jgi:hypothetical protein
MADLGQHDLVPIKHNETKTTKLKIIQSRKQELVSRIRALKQSIEDLKNGKIPLLERDIILAEDSLQQVLEFEKLVNKAIDA